MENQKQETKQKDESFIDLTDEQFEKIMSITTQMSALREAHSNFREQFVEQERKLFTEIKNKQIDLNKEIEYIFRGQKEKGTFKYIDYKNRKIILNK